MAGILYLIPNTLASPGVPAEALSTVIPEDVQALTARLGYFIAENAKTTRAFLKHVARRHPLARPLQEILIEELNVNTEAATLPGLGPRGSPVRLLPEPERGGGSWAALHPCTSLSR